jgi:DNA polymerase elongation subunit (family B)
MNELSFKDIESLLNRGDLNFYNFYNTDIETNNFLSVQHYIENPNDTSDVNQQLSVMFLDIEVYHENRNIKFEFDKSDHPINAITVYNTRDKCYKSFYLLRPINKHLFNSDTNYFITELKKDKYMTDEESFSLQIYEDELTLIRECWDYIRSSKVLLLSGFNSDYFDLPYIYRRLLKLVDKIETANILSEFKYVEFRNERVKIPDYSVCDLLYLYKPRSEGGLNYGSTLSSYSLDNVSEVELGLSKLDYKGQVTDINQFYEEDPTNYLLYNIIDVGLCKLLNEKLKHIELHNSLRRLMKIPFSNSLIGSSALFEGYTLFRLSEKNKKVRHGLVTQNNKTILEEDLRGIRRPNTKKNEITPIAIKSKEYTSLICKFDGAYVKEPKPQIIQGTIIDLDATALYPSKILESNIGFDTYRARIINPNVYKTLQLFESHLGIQELPPLLYANVFKLIEDYVVKNKKKITNQAKFKRQMYYTFMFLLQRIIESNEQIKNIYEPKTDDQHYLLMFYLLPLLDLLNNLHPSREAFNPFVYDHIFKNENEVRQIYPIVYILNNAGGSSPSIKKMNTADTISFMNNFSFTICGTCFDKHENNIGIYSEMLKNLSALRKSYNAKLAEYSEGTNEYDFYDSRQKSVKVASNSSYGVFGLSSFRYSNHWLAQSITSQGRLTIKISQYLTENFLLQQVQNNEQ